MREALSLLYNSTKNLKPLPKDEELNLAYAWRDEQDVQALHKLTMAYLRYTISEAKKYKNSGVPLDEITQQASIGLMRAANKFDPDKGFRFSTYARWWIRSEIRDLMTKDNGVVTGDTSVSRRTLFSNGKRALAQIEREAFNRGERLSQDEMRHALAEKLRVKYEDVVHMESYSAGAYSLDAPVRKDEAEGSTGVDLLEDEDAIATEELIGENNFQERISDAISDALQILPERDRDILFKRRLLEDPFTLEQLSQEYGVSRERIRQIEVRAVDKLKKYLEDYTEVPAMLAA